MEHDNRNRTFMQQKRLRHSPYFLPFFALNETQVSKHFDELSASIRVNKVQKGVFEAEWVSQKGWKSMVEHDFLTYLTNCMLRINSSFH